MAHTTGYTKEEVMQALTLIKSLCNNTSSCDVCPLYSHNYANCNVTLDTPDGWNLITPGTWKAFKEI